jgi:hypothetical protein
MSKEKSQRPDPAKELRLLKDFQRKSVDATFSRLYGGTDPVRRFLVADEVGLGKTLVARGLITRVIDYLWDEIPRIDIIYLCSNSDIARQNVRRLTPSGIKGVSVASRITLLPLETHGLKDRRVNVLALTPSTSLDLKENLGLRRERALILHVLRGIWKFDWIGACHLFRGKATHLKFKTYVNNFEAWETNIDADLAAQFVKAIQESCKATAAVGKPTLQDRMVTLVDAFKGGERPTRELQTEQRKFIGELRQILGQACLRALEPDLIILDEFQRFKDLLSGEGSAGEMAKQLFDYEHEQAKARVLLLSATPYKMYTLSDEAGDEDHYSDFVRTARFLLSETPAAADQLEVLLKTYRREAYRVAQGGIETIGAARDGIEAILRRVMLRTERLAVTQDRSGMLVEKPVTRADVDTDYARSYLQLQAIGKAVDSADTIEFWKAAPWLPNFMDDYKLRREIELSLDDSSRSGQLVKALRNAPDALLQLGDAKAFNRLSPPHAKLKWLTEHTLDNDLWKLLWLPPSLPYYALGEPFQSVAAQSPTKALVFSAWVVVPRVIAAALSHEAERRMYRLYEGDEKELLGSIERHGDLLQLTRREGQAAGLTAVTAIYPSFWLAENCDPMRIGAELSRELGRVPTVAEVIARAEERVRPAVEKQLKGDRGREAPDESWYWALPIMLDRAANRVRTEEWMASDLVALWTTGADKKKVADDELDDDEAATMPAGNQADRSATADAVERMRAVLEGERPSGSPPKDIVRMVALMGLGGAATVALRSLVRVLEGVPYDTPEARSGAARIANGFRTLFNQPDSSAVIRASAEPGDYWKQCLEYSVRGCLQAVIDEYAHLLVGDTGAFDKPAAEVIGSVSDAMCSALSIRRASIGATEYVATESGIKRQPHRIRSRFAMRFGEERADASGDRMRADDVRSAFNSPFWPFVLATTSVGQEGLDFHYYCHAVIHWNLPPNPVDLEQREGRVHRYKGHAVRKNVAKRHENAWRGAGVTDPWQSSFEEARTGRAEGENDLVPYWVYPLEGGAAIERHVPNLPLSRDVGRFEALKKSLALYRMVFGQPRQNELLAYLSTVVPKEQIAEVAERMRISLAP